MKNYIKVERARMDLTQEQLAIKVNVTKQTIHSIETGKYTPSAVLALKIATVFNKKVDDIFILENRDWE